MTSDKFSLALVSASVKWYTVTLQTIDVSGSVDLDHLGRVKKRGRQRQTPVNSKEKYFYLRE